MANILGSKCVDELVETIIAVLTMEDASPELRHVARQHVGLLWEEDRWLRRRLVKEGVDKEYDH